MRLLSQVLLVFALASFPALAFISCKLTSRHVTKCLQQSNQAIPAERNATYQQHLPNVPDATNLTRPVLKTKNKLSSTSKLSPYRSRKGRDQERHSNSITKDEALSIVRRSKSSKEINDWISSLAQMEKSSFAQWNMKDQNDFIRLLKDCRAFDAIVTFTIRLARQHVFVYTTAMFAVAVSSNDRGKALLLLDQMDDRDILPTALTYTALLGSVDGPKEVLKMMSRLKEYQDVVKLTDAVFDSAIFACGRLRTSSSHDMDSTWQTALSLFRQMRGQRIAPTTKTYLALMQVLGKTGQVKIALSILDELRNSPNLKIDERVWGAAINVCAQAADYKSSIQVIRYMQEEKFKPNIHHCSALLKSMSKSGQYKLALRTLQIMVDGGTLSLSKRPDLSFTLPLTRPDLVALNTVMAACSKAGNYNATKALFDRVRTGEFNDPETGEQIAPDRISYHSVLAACRSPDLARELVKEMRLSRRHRYGAVPPTNVTYAHAINACQKADIPDMKTALLFLDWARDDAIQPSIFMYSSAIWTAQRCGEYDRAISLFQDMKSAGCKPNSVAYDGVISALCKQGNLDEILFLYNEMKSRGIDATVVTMSLLVRVIRGIGDICTRLRLLEGILDNMTLKESEGHIGGPVYEELISTYSSIDHFDDALRVFEGINGRIDVSCLRAMLLACGKTSPPRWEQAVSLLHTSDIVAGTRDPGHVDQIALGLTMISCSKANRFEEALNLLQLYGIPRPKDVQGSIPVVAMNALIAACGRGGQPNLALAVLNDMSSKFGVAPDQRSYRSAVIACNQAEHECRRTLKNSDIVSSHEDDFSSTFGWWECALSLLRRMKEGGIIPDIRTYSSAISACEAAGEWQRALGILQSLLDDGDDNDLPESSLNLYCFNAAISACEKGGAWVEALDIYERILEHESLQPNFVTLNSLIVALDKSGQKELAQSKYEEGRKLKIVNPWRYTRDQNGASIYGLDLHQFSAAMASAAIRSVMESYRAEHSPEKITRDLVIITGKGLRSLDEPVLRDTVQRVLHTEYGFTGRVDPDNRGRLIVDREKLRQFASNNTSWE